jgi:4-alpha-glucanotransferase
VSVPERTTDRWGVDYRYEDAFGDWHEAPEETRREIHRVMRDGLDSAFQHEPVIVVHERESARVPASGDLYLEDGRVLPIAGTLPRNLPVGYHTLHHSNASTRVIVHPGACYLPADLKTWGWSIQLYALRSQGSWGIGDFADLRRFADWSHTKDAGILLVNPLHAVNPVLPQQASPYYPSTRRYRNPLYLRVEEVPGWAEAGIEIERLARMGRELNSDRLIDRDAVFRLKMEALELLWTRFVGTSEFDRYCAREGQDLESFATFCTLAEQHATGWMEWPSAFRHPGSDAVREFAKRNVQRVRFHMWVQWLIEEQLSRASASVGVMQDLPIGVDPGGADAWALQDMLSLDMSVGAPPDEFNTSGQNWGLPPFVPHKLRAAAYEPFIQTIRSTLRSAGGLRIDHVMGLFRLFWIPQGRAASQGAYVRYRADELLAIVAIESQRARALVVGEDLGTVESGVRDKLAEYRLLSYKLLWFEKKAPTFYPEHALAAITTHDLPTVAGLWNGSDLERQSRLDLHPNEEGTAGTRLRLQEMAVLAEDAHVEQVIMRAHELLAMAPCKVVAATIEDALQVQERPNMPATTTEQSPNWSLALPKSLEDLIVDPLAQKIASILSTRLSRA